VFGRWPWPRLTIAMAIDFLSRGQPKVIAVDLAFLEADNRLLFKVGDGTMSGKESDDILAASIAKAGNVVLAADAVYHGTTGGEQALNFDQWSVPPYRLGPAIEERPLITPPIPSLSKAAAAIGHNLMTLDTDGRARRMPPFIRVRDRYIPSLGVAAGLMAARVKPEEVSLADRWIHIRDRAIPIVPTSVPDLAGSGRHDMLAMLINYRAPRLVNGERSYPLYEIRHLIASEDQVLGGEKPALDPGVFKDKIVFIGLGASGLVDVFSTPFGEVLPGVQVHATMTDNLLSGRFIRRQPAPDYVRLTTTIGFALIVALMATSLPYAAAATGALIVVGGWAWLGLYTFRGGLWLNMVQPLLSSVIALFAGTAYQYFVEGAEKRAVKKLFGRYVSKDVFDQLMAHPELAELGGARREMTVLFSDIRGFTAVTEKGDPELLVSQLNEYFSRMVAIVFRHHGTVDKFVGDMVMALFSAPLDDPQHADHAVAAAVDMVKELGELNSKWVAAGRPQLDIGIGVNSGDMIAGNIGSSSIMSYTVIGDNVNLGSRLESLNKDYKTRIIISSATRSRIQGNYEIRPLGDVVVKGKTRPVAIFEVIVPSPLGAAHEEVKL
jgi:adenylate cyclase